MKRIFWGHKTNLTPPHFIEVPVPSQESERSCICARVRVSIMLLYDFAMRFWNCSGVGFLKLYLQTYMKHWTSVKKIDYLVGFIVSVFIG